MNKQLKVLIVEDEVPLAHALKLKLDLEGFKTELAENGQECMTALKRQSFDIILLDMKMPVMDGFHTLQALSDQNNKIPIFTLSNLSVDDDVSKVLNMGALKYFIKSDTPLSVIVDEVKKTLGVSA